jgi:hypothetical protein
MIQSTLLLEQTSADGKVRGSGWSAAIFLVIRRALEIGMNGQRRSARWLGHTPSPWTGNVYLFYSILFYSTLLYSTSLFLPPDQLGQSGNLVVSVRLSSPESEKSSAKRWTAMLAVWVNGG